MQPISGNREIKRDSILEIVKAKLRGVPSRREEIILSGFMAIVSEAPNDCETDEDQNLWLENQFLKLRARMEILSGCISLKEAVQLLNRKEHAVYMRIERGTLLAIKDGKEYCIPRWQFDLSRDNQLVHNFDQVLYDLHETAAYDHATFQNKLLWLNRPWGGFNGEKPIDVLRAGKTAEVIEYLQSMGSGYR